MRRVFETGVSITLAGAVSDTDFNIHGTESFRRGRERTGATVRAASNVLVSEGAGDVGEVRLICSDGWVGTGSNDSSLARTLSDGVATRKLRQNTSDCFINRRRNNACLALSSSEQIENGTIREKTAVVSAGINSRLKGIDIPSVDEITVKPVASWVTLSKYERLAASVPHVGETGSAVDNFVEYGDHVNRVRGWARAVIYGTARRIGHVRLVIGRVKVDTVPARWEEDLGAEAVRAVFSWQTR